eukprot:1291620-Pyramimonas_sp.AAC.2
MAYLKAFLLLVFVIAVSAGSIDLTGDTFEDVVVGSGKNAIVKFYAPCFCLENAPGVSTAGRLPASVGFLRDPCCGSFTLREFRNHCIGLFVLGFDKLTMRRHQVRNPLRLHPSGRYNLPHLRMLHQKRATFIEVS